MPKRAAGTMIAVLIVAAAAVVARFVAPTSAQAPASAWKTAWGEPDLQGIWTDESDTLLQRPAKYADQEFFTAEQRAEIDRQRAAVISGDKRAVRGTGIDVNQGYNSVFMSLKHVGARTSLIVDPPNGRLPLQTPEAQKIIGADREFRLALIRSTDTCKNKLPSCNGGTYDPAPSPRRAELPPRYNVGRMNRHDGPEDATLGERCLTGGLPEFGTAFGGSFRRIIQTPGGVAMYYDVGQGQGWPRNIVMNGSPHLPPSIRQWYGDSRGHWEGDTLVIDVTNFSPKVDFQGSRENLHLVERWTRTGPGTLEYVATVDDPTVWTRPWTVNEEFTRQSDEQNRIYYEPRCNEGNYALSGLLRGRRAEERAFAVGQGPDPATFDNMTAGSVLDADPLR